MIGHIGLSRAESAYITNVLFWRPPGNRTPTPDEIGACLPFVERHIELVDPAVIVLVGGIAAKTMLARSEGITKLRGQWHSYETPRMSHPVPIIATFHPAYLLRSPGQKTRKLGRTCSPCRRRWTSWASRRQNRQRPNLTDIGIF